MLLLESFDEPLEQPCPDLILADLVLDAVLEIGVVVDLHDDKAAVGLLDVDAVEALADRPRRAHGDVDQLGRGLVELEGAKAALVRGTGRAATGLCANSSIRKTLLVQRIMEIGSSMTGMPSCQARRAKR